ncbi:MAG: 4-hydroxythreonine-4-phosphate dehydrogenase PdxA [Deltaproteobacteria bacterium]|nr:4-hydroxythreonine-4-phosphate dehydrogenase PdxA [Deltaproteobacteria bacterium]
MSLPLIGITMGDPVGIGPEIIAKALIDPRLYELCRPVVIGDRAVIERELAGGSWSGCIEVVENINSCQPAADRVILIEVSRLDPAALSYGKPTPETGRALGACIVKAVELARSRCIDAVVTAPINKQSLHEGGYEFPGHTEMLAELTGAEHVVMMLAGERLRVVLVTIHCALAQVPELLTSALILRTIETAWQSMQSCFGIAEPRLAVAGLNPHAGEGALFGTEERDIIRPAIEEARAKGMPVSGPHPPDTVFYQAAHGAYDAVVCMYHDQGLIPLKLLHFEDGVNVTLGLPILRTSVDHGTAYDIAGKGIASSASLMSAVKMAVEMAGNKKVGELISS